MTVQDLIDKLSEFDTTKQLDFDLMIDSGKSHYECNDIDGIEIKDLGSVVWFSLFGEESDY